MSMPFLRRIARNGFARRCANVQSGVAAIETWKLMPLELAAYIEPLANVPPIAPLADDLEAQFYSEMTEEIDVEGRTVKLDVLDGDEQNLTNARESIQAFRNGVNDEQHFLQLAPIWFLQAGDAAFELGQHNRALRCYLNARRLIIFEDDQRSATLRESLGHCLLELGDFENAGTNFALAGERLTVSGRLDEAAHNLEKAAICWEMLSGDERYRMNTANGRYDSIICSRTAKYLFLNVGDYLSASRCSVTEQDCLSRWSSSGSHLVKRFMRVAWLYGESPIFVLRCLAILLAALTTVLFYCGYKRGEEIVNYDLAFSFDLGWKPFGDFFDALYLAIVTITTLGYGDLSPASGISKLVAGIASFSGIVFAAMLIVSLQRRYVGR